MTNISSNGKELNYAFLEHLKGFVNELLEKKFDKDITKSAFLFQNNALIALDVSIDKNIYTLLYILCSSFISDCVSDSGIKKPIVNADEIISFIKSDELLERRNKILYTEKHIGELKYMLEKINTLRNEIRNKYHSSTAQVLLGAEAHKYKKYIL